MRTVIEARTLPPMAKPAPPCEYPTCDAMAVRPVALVIQPEPITVSLCAEHLAIVQANELTPGTDDFWRWFEAMAGLTG